jgi:hypothetical protein
VGKGHEWKWYAHRPDQSDSYTQRNAQWLHVYTLNNKNKMARPKSWATENARVIQKWPRSGKGTWMKWEMHQKAEHTLPTPQNVNSPNGCMYHVITHENLYAGTWNSTKSMVLNKPVGAGSARLPMFSRKSVFVTHPTYRSLLRLWVWGPVWFLGRGLVYRERLFLAWWVWLDFIRPSANNLKVSRYQLNLSLIKFKSSITTSVIIDFRDMLARGAWLDFTIQIHK